jgi:hypothetical protein
MASDEPTSLAGSSTSTGSFPELGRWGSRDPQAEFDGVADDLRACARLVPDTVDLARLDDVVAKGGGPAQLDAD